MDELFILRYGKFERIPDLVAWPESQSDVEALVKFANTHNVAIIPYGGKYRILYIFKVREMQINIIFH